MNRIFLQRLIFSRSLIAALCLSAQCSAAVSAESVVDEALLDKSLDELINMVTVRKRPENGADVPATVTNFPQQTLRDFNIRSFIDYATKTPNLSFAYGNGFTVGNPSTGLTNSRTFAIRGIAGARANGFYIDDIPIPDAVDPRVLDLKNIEILKGPQGTLFGEGSLGGNIRFISKVPNLYNADARYMLEAGKTEQGDKINTGAEAIGKLLMVPGKAALRIAVAADDTGGYLKRTYLSDINNPASPRIYGDNQGEQRNLAGSITGLLRATPDLDISLRLMYQDKVIDGFSATWAPLPAFLPQYTMDRVANLQSQAEDSWTLPSLSLNYRGAGWAFSSTTSLFNRHTRDLEDSTEGTLQITPGMPVQPSAWISTYDSRQVANETRVTFDPVGKLSGTVGVFYSQHQTDYAIPPVYAQGVTPPLLWQESESNTQGNVALFGELYYKFLDRWTLTLGDRKYWLNQEDTHTVLVSNVNNTVSGSSSSSGNSPKIALAYQMSDTAMVYGSAAQGFRQGNSQLDASVLGCGPSLATLGTTAEALRKITPDSLWSYEAGGKFVWPKPGLMLTVSAFHIDWENPQQQLLLTNCGLFVQGNAGAARSNGGELELTGHVNPSLQLRFGIGYEDAVITKAGNTGQAVGSRIYQTPLWTGSMGAVYSHHINDTLKGLIAADYSYTGNSISSNNGPLNLVRPGYSLVNLRTGVSWGKSELSLNIKNLTDAKPNLGDITYIGYGLYTDASRTTPVPQVATLPPRTIMLQYRGGL